MLSVFGIKQEKNGLDINKIYFYDIKMSIWNIGFLSVWLNR